MGRWLSEYRYYEFQAVDRPLDEADRKALRALSSRARITAASFTNHYERGDFKGSPVQLVERWFDLHLHVASWGTRRLMMRLPRRLVDHDRLDAWLVGTDLAEILEAGDNLILDIRDDGEEALDRDWDDGSGWLAAMAPLRADLLSGDWRLPYLLRLTGVEDGSVRDEALEPLSGIAPLSAGLLAFADFFRIDGDLAQAAAEAPGDAPSQESSSAGLRAALRAEIAALPESEAPGHSRGSRQHYARQARCGGAARQSARLGKPLRGSGDAPKTSGGSERRRRQGAHAWQLCGCGARMSGARSKSKSAGATLPATTGRRA